MGKCEDIWTRVVGCARAFLSTSEIYRLLCTARISTLWSSSLFVFLILHSLCDLRLLSSSCDLPSSTVVPVPSSLGCYLPLSHLLFTCCLRYRADSFGVCSPTSSIASVHLCFLFSFPKSLYSLLVFYRTIDSINVMSDVKEPSSPTTASGTHPGMCNASQERLEEVRFGSSRSMPSLSSGSRKAPIPSSHCSGTCGHHFNTFSLIISAG